MEEGPEGDEGQSYIVLRHSSGSTVYVVGTAHVSRKAAQDVAALISRVNPAVVVLELDPEREKKLLEQAQKGDTYGISKLRDKGTWEIIKMSFTGEGLSFFMSAVYTITGAVMGTTPGGEFLAAIEAAQGVGAQIVLADRSQEATMRRLQYYTRHLARRDSRSQADIRRMRSIMDTGRKEDGGQGPSIDQPTSIDVGRQPDFMQREPPPTRREVEEEVAATPNAEDPWGLGPDDATEAGMKRRLLELMREGGCAQPNAVLDAARRILQQGMDPKGSISAADILAVRECGNSLVESFRQRAIRGDSTWMHRLEEEQLAGARGAAGAELSHKAMRKVIVDERDLILARRLWEAGLQAGSQPVVGVVGAGHLQGISRYWPLAGEPATEHQVERYLQAPEDEVGSPWLTAAVGTAVLGTIAYRRPRAAALFAGAVVLTTAPVVGFMFAAVNRFGKFAQKVVSSAEMIDGGEGVGADMGAGWGGGEGGMTGGNSDSEWK